MHDAHAFLEALALVLCVAAVTTVVFQRLRQPVVLGYVLAGLIVGPHTPIPLIADAGIVQTLSELGVILLMFSLGLEFSLSKLVRVGPAASVTAILQCGLMLWLGFLVARAFGWTVREAMFTGAIIAISSTTIIAKAFDEQGVRGRLRELVVSVLIVEDLIAILLMAALTAMTTARDGLSASALFGSAGKLAAFLFGLLAIGMLIVPRIIVFVTRLGRAETTLVASVGICFASALLALKFGYSVALGSFLAGSLIAESGHEKHVEHLVEPVRDMFAAVFFVSVGMSIDPHVIITHAGAIAALTTIVIVGKIVGVSAGAFLTGAGTRMSLEAGMSLAQIGEFSFIIAGLGVTLDATGSFLYPVAVAVSAITTLSTPWLIRVAPATARMIDGNLPRSLQTFAAVYSGWLERLRTTPQLGATKAVTRRVVRFLVLDAVLLSGLVVASAVYAKPAAAWVSHRLEIAAVMGRGAVIAMVLITALPLCIGLLRGTRLLGVTLVGMALPPVGGDENKADKTQATRRALVLTLQLAAVVMVGLPVLVVSQPFLRGLGGTLVFCVLLLGFGFSVWRSAERLQGQVTAGVELVAAALSSQAKIAQASPSAAATSLRGTETPSKRKASDVESLLAGLGAPKTLRLAADNIAVGRSLSAINLRGLTGATVLAIARETDVFVPTAAEMLRTGDILALAGSRESVDGAVSLLQTGAVPSVAALDRPADSESGSETDQSG